MKNEMIVNYQETSTELKVTFKKASLKYLDEFIKLKCAPDLLLNKLFPNAKEITESMAAFNAYRKNLIFSYPPNEEKTTCLVVGDGVVPRTGAVFALRTKFNVISVDPAMRLPYEHPWAYHLNINRLLMLKAKAEEEMWDLYLGNPKDIDKLIIIAVHSHAPLDKLIKRIEIKTGYKEFVIISNPCCYEDNIEHLDTITKIASYNDWGIHSEKRRINIYKYVKGERNE